MSDDKKLTEDEVIDTPVVYALKKEPNGSTKGEIKTYSVKGKNHTHKGTVLAIGDELTPKNIAQCNFLKDIKVI